MMKNSESTKESTGIHNSLDSLIENFSGETLECIRMLELASYNREYFPEGKNYYKFGLIEHLSNHSSILDCVSEEIQKGNSKAEKVLLQYLSNYYDEILTKGKYESPIPFSYLGSSRSKEAVVFLHKLALDEAICTFDKHEILDSRPIHGLGQVGIISRARIDGQPLEYEDFKTDYSRYITRNSEVSSVKLWKDLFLPVLNRAKQEGRLSYITYTEELQFQFPWNWFY